MELVTEKYKQTEVGLIPSDWEVKLLSELGENLIGLTYSPKDVKEYGHLVLRSSNIQNNKLAFENNVFVEMELPNRVIVKENDILICVRNGSKNLIGKCALIDKKTEGSAFGAFMSVYRTDYSNYIFHQFQSDIIQRQIDEVMGATINQLTNKDLATFQIPLPPTKAEQTAIATALSDADALINSLEKLIAKKRNIKQGAMQQLLKPKEGWEVKKLGEVAEIYQPQTISQDVFIDDGYLVYGANGIVGKYHLYNHETWQTTITCRGSTCGTVNRTVGKSWITGNAMVMNVDKNTNIDKLFFYYILTKQDFSQCITGSGQPQIVRNPLFEFKVSIPKTNEEQTRIATILSDMDAEITALETKLEKFRKVKLGMMQNLLTGKIRLV